MEGRRAALLGGGQQVVVRLLVGAGEFLAVVVFAERLRAQQPAGELHAGQQDAAVAFGGEVVRLDGRRLERIGRAGAHVADAVGPLLPRGDRHAGEVVEGRLHAFLVAGRGEGELQVVVVDPLVGFPEHVDQRRVEGEDALARGGIFQHLAHQPQPVRLFIDAGRVLHAGDEARRIVVAQVLADARQGVLHRDAQRLQQRRRPDAGDLQELRAVHGAAAQDHFLVGAHLHRPAVAAALAVAHADGPLAVEHDLRRLGMRAHGEVRPLHRRMQVAARGAHAPSVPDDALHVADAGLHRAVVVAVARDPHLHRALDEGLAQGIAPVEIGDRQLALVAAEGLVHSIGDVGDALFAAPEVRQHVGIAPAVIAALGPAVEVEPLATIVDVAVDRTGAAQRLAAGSGDAPAAGPLAGLGTVEPVHPRIDQRVHEAGGNMDEGMPVRGTRLEDADGGLLVLAQAAGQHAAGRAGAHDHIVETFHPRLPPAVGDVISALSAGSNAPCRGSAGPGRPGHRPAPPRKSARRGRRSA